MAQNPFSKTKYGLLLGGPKHGEVAVLRGSEHYFYTVGKDMKPEKLVYSACKTMLTKGAKSCVVHLMLFEKERHPLLSAPYLAEIEAFAEKHGEWIDMNLMADASAALSAPQPPSGGEVVVETAGFVRENSDGDRYIDWTLEGGIAALEDGCELIVSAAKITDDTGAGTVYTAPPSAPVGVEDDFNGDTSHLIRSIESLLRMDAIGALVPYGIGGHARKLLSAAATRLAAQQPAADSAAKHWHNLYRAECLRRQDDAARYGQQIADLEARQPAAVVDDRFPGGLADAISYADECEEAAGSLYAQAFGAESDGSDTAPEMLRAIERRLQQPEAEPRSTHRVWRGDDWLPCYCAATNDHPIGQEQPAAVDGDEVRRVAQHIGTAADYIDKAYPDAKMLDRGPILRNMRRWRERLAAALAAQPGDGR